MTIPPVGHAGVASDAIAPDGSEIRLLIDDRHAATRASLVEVTLGAGQVSRPVWHHHVEEIWYVLSGSGEVWRCPPDVDISDAAPMAVGPGNALTIPTGWRFQFRVMPAGPLRFLCFTSPPWPGPDEAQAADVGGLGEPTV